MSLTLEIAVAHRPMPGERACGDRAISWDDGEEVVVAVADGLGHGPQAELAAEAAIAYVAEHRTEPLIQLFLGCDQAIRGTRGVALTVVRIRRATGESWHAAVGNVEARILGSGDVGLLTTPGVVGGRCRRVKERPFLLRPGTLLILHTDGISSRFRPLALRGLRAAAVIDTLITKHAKGHDDAGCAVVVA